MKIAHVSDLHISVLYKRNNVYKVQKIFDNITRKDIDHIVIAGDIADNAEWKELLIFRNILQQFGLLDTKKVTITIGNHDVFGGVQTAEDVLNFPSKCKKINYNEAVVKFAQYFAELFDDVKFLNPNSIFPYVKTVEECCFFGINSIDHYSTMRNPFASNGYVFDEQYHFLSKEIKNEKYNSFYKIPVIHHHFYKNNMETSSSASKIWDNVEKFTMKLRKKKRLIKLFSESNVKLVLHGHSHEMIQYERKGIQFINAGASVDNKSNFCSYYIIDTKNENIKTEEVKISVEHLQNIYDQSVHDIVLATT